MLNFTVGPVQSCDSVREIGAEDVPYFRTAEFSEIMLENEALVKNFVNAPKGSKVVFITGSGTASMEAAIMNVLTSNDRALVVNGGGFGQRFCKICDIHRVPYDEIKIMSGNQIRLPDIQDAASGKLHSSFIINKHETSTGVHYDMQLVSEYCKKNDLLLIVDNISSFLCDDFDMMGLGADVMITGSQKALACPPGVSIIVLSPRALARVWQNDPQSLYFDLKAALKDQERGQTPFTPAVQILLQINARLKEIVRQGGVAKEVAKSKSLAEYFREKIKELPLEIVSESLSNAVTPLHPTNGMSAYDIFLKLKDEHEIWVCPNGGDMKDKVFRVGHMGCLNKSDYDKLVFALKEVMK